MKKVLVALVLLGGLFCAVTWFLPSEVHVERTLTINAPTATIFAHVNDLKEWEKWSPWYEQEPTATYTYGDKTAGEGAWVSWKGEKVGEGKQTIVGTTEESITTKLDFADQGPATASWKFEELDEGTKVTWGFDTNMGMNPIGKIMGLMLDKWVGGDYAKGLEKLRQVCEADSAVTGNETLAPADPAEASDGDSPEDSAESTS